MRHRQRTARAAIVFAFFAMMGPATLAARGPDHGHAGSSAAPGSRGHGNHECETREPHGNGQGNTGSRGNSSHQSADDCAPQGGNDEPGTNGPPDISFDGSPDTDQNVVTDDDHPRPAQVPEPASLILFSGGLIAGVRTYRKRRSGTR